MCFSLLLFLQGKRDDQAKGGKEEVKVDRMCFESKVHVHMGNPWPFNILSVHDHHRWIPVCSGVVSSL